MVHCRLMSSRRALLLSIPGHSRTSTRLFSCSSKRYHNSIFNAANTVYISESTNPFFNLSLEDYLFRHHPSAGPTASALPKGTRQDGTQGKPLLFLYRDAPCVVIGRNQNVWKEVNLDYLSQENEQRAQENGDEIRWVRRHSGGGAVYHDLGNTNFSIHIPRVSFDRKKTGELATRAVRNLLSSAGVEGAEALVQLNDRNDVSVGGKKVSGSAYKIVANRAYHHGTMLISTQLNTLGPVLRVERPDIKTKGVESVRSPVSNLRDWAENKGRVTHEKFMQEVIKEFQRKYYPETLPYEIQPVHVKESSMQKVEPIQKSISDMQKWDWAFGQNPEFTQDIVLEPRLGLTDVKPKVVVTSKHGVIISATVESVTPDSMGETNPTDESLEKALQLVVGRQYGLWSILESDCAPQDHLDRELFMHWLIQLETVTGQRSA